MVWEERGGREGEEACAGRRYILGVTEGCEGLNILSVELISLSASLDRIDADRLQRACRRAHRSIRKGRVAGRRGGRDGRILRPLGLVGDVLGLRRSRDAVWHREGWEGGHAGFTYDPGAT